MTLRSAKESDLPELMTWFSDPGLAYQWGGPGLRFPFDTASFKEDVHFDEMATYVYRGNDGSLTAFGQFYEKSGRCHLARLAVNPTVRGQGTGQKFVAELLQRGLAELKLETASLFVLKTNAAAIHCYRKLGFRQTPWPVGQEVFTGIIFMIM